MTPGNAGLQALLVAILRTTGPVLVADSVIEAIQPGDRVEAVRHDAIGGTRFSVREAGA